MRVDAAAYQAIVEHQHEEEHTDPLGKQPKIAKTPTTSTLDRKMTRERIEELLHLLNEESTSEA